MDMCTFRSTILYKFWILVQIKATSNLIKKWKGMQMKWWCLHVIGSKKFFFFHRSFAQREHITEATTITYNNNKQKWTESRQMEFLFNTLNFKVTIKMFYCLKHQSHMWIWDLVMVLEAILTCRQLCGKLQCFYENLMSQNFRKMAVLEKKNVSCKLKPHS